MSELQTATLRKTALFDLHERQGGRMVPFAGWSMPVQYKGIVEEHNAVRHRAGVFDVSHMGRLFVVGADAERLLRSAVTYNVAKIKEGRGHYSLLCNEDGGIIDDPYIYRLDPQRFLVVGNASNADRDLEQMRSLVRPGMDVELLDRQEQTVMLAVQGPAAAGFMARVIGPEVAAMGQRACTELPFMQYKLFVSRTGYTGEDGFEIVTSPEAGRAIWRQLVADGVEPCGLGARDTLRLEAALPLWGNDIDETTTPYEAGLGWVVSLDDGADFVGRDALAQIKAAGPARKLTCLKATDRGVIRDHYAVLHGGETVGTVASGGFSPTLGVSIAMAYLPLALTTYGTELDVDVRGRMLPVVVVRRPFVVTSNGRRQSARQVSDLPRKETGARMAASPDDRKYSKEHEWLKIDGDAATIGITDYAQDQLGDVVYVDLPEPGATITQFEKMGEIESVKAVSDLYTPASGEVIEANQLVVEKPELVNGDPHGSGWLLKIKLRDAAELDKLLSASDYDAFIAATQGDEAIGP